MIVVAKGRKTEDDSATSGGKGRDEPYRHYLADLILSYATRNGALDKVEAYKQVMAVTHRSIVTVRSWLSLRTSIPDAPSLARIVNHWKIPPASVFPGNLDALLQGDDAGDLKRVDDDEKLRSIEHDHVLVPLYGTKDPTVLDHALSKYTDHPRSTIFFRYDGSEMLDQIRPGELVLVDASTEHISKGGLYLLKFAPPGQRPSVIARFAEILLGEPAVRLSHGSMLSGTSAEVVPLRDDGQLPPSVTVLGRIVAVLRQA